MRHGTAKYLACIVTIALTLIAAPAAAAPPLSLLAKVQASDGVANNYFGSTLALSADGSIAAFTALSQVCGTIYCGAVYLFERSQNVWTQQAKISPPAGAQGFGNIALSRDGSTIALTGGDSNQRKVSIYTRAGQAWTLQQELTARNPTEYWGLGPSIALSGDGNLLLTHGNGTDGTGMYAFARAGGIWSLQQVFNASDTVFDFTAHVALSADGGVALIGAPFKTVGSNTDQGAAYVFTRGGGSWNQQQQLIAADGQAYRGFGETVALSTDGSTALIGLVSSISPTVYIYARGGTWTLQQELTGTEFDSPALSGDGNTLLTLTPDLSDERQNMVKVWSRTGTTWGVTQQISVTDDSISAFGIALATNQDGSVALAGAQGKAYRRGNEFEHEAGSAFFFGVPISPLPVTRPTDTPANPPPNPAPSPRSGGAGPSAGQPTPAPLPPPR